MRKKRLTFLQRIGVALVGAGVLLVICSVDPYSNGFLNVKELLVRIVQAGLLIEGGRILYRPWPTQRDEHWRR